MYVQIAAILVHIWHFAARLLHDWADAAAAVKAEMAV